MEKMIASSTLAFLFTLFLNGCNATASDAAPARAPDMHLKLVELKVDGLSDGQRITENVPTQFRITPPDGTSSISVAVNGEDLGKADFDDTTKQYRFLTTFSSLGDRDVTFTAFPALGSVAIAQSTYRLQVVRDENEPAPSKYFNAWILKSVQYLTKNYGLLGYNINSQNTHNMEFYKYGTLKPTGNGLTMCVAGVLEVIVTAFDLYNKETGDHSPFDFLPFKSWSTLATDGIKALIWVNPKLNSSGTGDAIAKFGVGERVKFRDLEPGGFININRTTGSGHAVTFLSFIDAKGNDVVKYDDSVVGFRYFGAQGKGIKGQGGLSYRHAFFSKFGCPEVPYQRDCNVIFSDNTKLLNIGMMLHPSKWKKPGRNVLEEEPAPTAEEAAQMFSPQDFDGRTTDD